MPAERFFLSHPLEVNDEYILMDSEYHHLVNVMRCQLGNSIEVVNGCGVLANADVVSIEKKKAFVKITQRSFEEKQYQPIILAQAIPRISRLDGILEKATELGISELWLFPGERSEKKEINDHQFDRFKTILISAMKQSGRLYLPEIILKEKLQKWEKPSQKLFFGDLSEAVPSFKEFWKEPPPESLVFFIGPESGFSNIEIEILCRWQAQGVKLNNNILRTDTAAIAAVTLMSHWLLTPYSLQRNEKFKSD